MANDATPYISRNPGDLLSAGDWNQVQVDIKKDIGDQVTTAIGQIDNVPHAGDADKLDGKSLEDITKDIIQKVLEAIREKAGNYKRIFMRLELCQEKFITHGLSACPLVDAYQLDYFLVVCAKGENVEDELPSWVNFYLYHSTERRIRIPISGGKAISVDIEPSDTRPSRLKFSDLLSLYNISYTDTTDLEELEAAFWSAFLPNDEFDTGQYCHSPWFEKCCGERRSVKELKDRGDWDKIYLKWMPRKTVNLLPLTSTTSPIVGGEGTPTGTTLGLNSFAASCTNKPNHPEQITPAPTQIQVIHYDVDTIGVRLVDTPVYPADQFSGYTDKDGNQIPPLPSDYLKEIKLMLLLKV